MSTAVLAGAQLDDWIAESPDHYLSKAKAAAQQVNLLRQNRGRWRQQMQNSPLGDPTGLMHALEEAFSTMAQYHSGGSSRKGLKFSAEPSSIPNWAFLHFRSQLIAILLAARSLGKDSSSNLYIVPFIISNPLSLIPITQETAAKATGIPESRWVITGTPIHKLCRRGCPPYGKDRGPHQSGCNRQDDSTRPSPSPR